MWAVEGPANPVHLADSEIGISSRLTVIMMNWLPARVVQILSSEFSSRASHKSVERTGSADARLVEDVCVNHGC